MMKTEYDNCAPKKTTFPCIMGHKNSGITVIMVEEGVGFAIPGRIYKKGLYSKFWDMAHFTEMSGSVTLSNL